MSYLLDTHSFLWYISADAKLSASARAIIDDEQNLIIISIVSLWEIIIKNSLGKLPLKGSVADMFKLDIDGNDIEILPISENHLSALAALPHHHRDPFDRMIMAQSIAENLPIIGVDPLFDAYGTQRLS